MPESTCVDAPVLEPQHFRDLMAGVCAPVTVVTAVTPDGAPHGSTVSSFASLSLNPPLVSLAMDRSSDLLGVILSAERFGVNILGYGQDELARTFASRNVDRFATASWRWSERLPRLADAPAWIVCDLHRIVEGGDHLMLFGLVRTAESRAEPPLIYAHRKFGTHSGLVRVTVDPDDADERPMPLS
jgi:flavin reductase (DIM6/NTAB) family NADH-FMN oxidoreductase RutF